MFRLILSYEIHIRGDDKLPQLQAPNFPVYIDTDFEKLDVFPVCYSGGEKHFQYNFG